MLLIRLNSTLLKRVKPIEPMIQTQGREIEEFEHENIVKAKRRPFTNCAQVSDFPPLYLEANLPSLSSILRTRFLSKQPFPESQLVTIIEGVVYGLAYLEDQELQYGDVHTSNIFFDQLKGVYKLGNPFFTEPGVVQMKTAKRMSYLAPQQIERFHHQALVTPKTDVFTLGLTLLELSILQSSEGCFSKQLKILDAQIQRRLALAQTRYSSTLVKIIRECLIYDPASRPSPKKLATVLYDLSRGIQ